MLPARYDDDDDDLLICKKHSQSLILLILIGMLKKNLDLNCIYQDSNEQ